MDFQRWLREAVSELSESESPKRDAEILLEHVTGKSRTYLLAFGETLLISVHLIAVALTIGFFIVRYWWRYSNNPLINARWVRIAPHCIDTVLLLSGAGLMWKTGYLPFTDKGAWLTEKLFGVIIYIVLGFIALGRHRPRSQQTGFIAFLLGLVVLYIIIKLATTRIPLLG